MLLTRLFRRRNSPENTTPIAPPAGYAWVVSETMLVENGHALAELALWPGELAPFVDRSLGMITISTITKMPKGLREAAASRSGSGRAFFRVDRPHEIAKASVRAVREFYIAAAARRDFDLLVGKIEEVR